MAKVGRVRVGIDPYLNVSKKKAFGLIVLAIVVNVVLYGILGLFILWIGLQLLKGIAGG